jgi:hypothetical protein
MPGINAFGAPCTKDVDGRAFASPKRLRPRRRVKPGHDELLQMSKYHRALSLRANVVWTDMCGLMLLIDTAGGGAFNSATVVPPPVTTSSDIDVAASSSPETMTARKIRSIRRERDPSDLVPAKRQGFARAAAGRFTCAQWNAASGRHWPGLTRLRGRSRFGVAKARPSRSFLQTTR